MKCINNDSQIVVLTTLLQGFDMISDVCLCRFPIDRDA